MEWHGDDAIGVGDQGPTGGTHHTRHRQGQIVPILVFQTVDEAAGDIVIKCNGTRTGEDRGPGKGLWRDEVPDAEIHSERNAEAFAQGLFDEAKRRPTDRAEGSCIGGRSSAPGAGRRIDQGERRTLEPAPERGNTPEGAARFFYEGAQRAMAGCIACWSAARALALARARPMAQPAAAPAKPWWPA